MMDVVVVKTDSLGNEDWLTSFGSKPFYDYGNAICQAGNDGYAIVGITKEMVRPTEDDRRTYNNDLYVTWLNTEGSIIEEKTITRHGTEWANAVHVDRTGDLFVAGHSDGGAAGSLDFLLAKIKGLETVNRGSIRQ
jgi:hypothetical protein